MKKTKNVISTGLLLILLVSCSNNDKAPVEVDSFMLGGESVVAGNQFRLIPLADEMIILKGEGFSINKFEFHCILLSPDTASDSLYKGVIAMDLSARKFTKTQKYMAPEFSKWPSGTTEKDITIKFPILPGETYAGKGFFYFYLVNKNDKCMSNIIKWKVKFE